LKVPRQCPIVLAAKACTGVGKALGSEGGKAMGSGMYYEQRRKFLQALYCVQSEF
jgi:hypothetical protein